MSTNLTHDGVDVSAGSPPFTSLKSFNAGIKTITFENNITRIGAQCATYAVLLETVDIPEGIENIGENAFQGCTGLKSVKFPKSLKSIGYGSFEGCINLVTIDLMLPVLSNIAANAFANCKNLKKFSTNKIEKLGQGVFKGCTSLVDSESVDLLDTRKVLALCNQEGNQEDGKYTPTPKASNTSSQKETESPITDSGTTPLQPSPAPSSTLTSTTPSPNLMIPKKFYHSRSVSALADRVNNVEQTSLGLSRTLERRPYRGAIAVKGGNWREEGEDEENESLWDMQARGKDDDDDEEEELVERKKGKKKKKKGKRFSSDEDSEEDGMARTLPPGGLENMVDYLAVTEDDNVASDSSDDDVNLDPMSDVIISESTSVFVAQAIPVGDEWYYVQGDSEDSDGTGGIKGRRGKTKKYYEGKKKGRRKMEVKEEGSSSESDDDAKSSGKKKKKRSGGYSSSESDDEAKAEAK